MHAQDNGSADESQQDVTSDSSSGASEVWTSLGHQNAPSANVEHKETADPVEDKASGAGRDEGAQEPGQSGNGSNVLNDPAAQVRQSDTKSKQFVIYEGSMAISEDEALKRRQTNRAYVEDGEEESGARRRKKGKVPSMQGLAKEDADSESDWDTDLEGREDSEEIPSESERSTQSWERTRSRSPSRWASPPPREPRLRFDESLAEGEIRTRYKERSDRSESELRRGRLPSPTPTRYNNSRSGERSGRRRSITPPLGSFDRIMRGVPDRIRIRERSQEDSRRISRPTRRERSPSPVVRRDYTPDETLDSYRRGESEYDERFRRSDQESRKRSTVPQDRRVNSDEDEYDARNRRIDEDRIRLQRLRQRRQRQPVPSPSPPPPPYYRRDRRTEDASDVTVGEYENSRRYGRSTRSIRSSRSRRSSSSPRRYLVYDEGGSTYRFYGSPSAMDRPRSLYEGSEMYNEAWSNLNDDAASQYQRLGSDRTTGQGPRRERTAHTSYYSSDDSSPRYYETRRNSPDMAQENTRPPSPVRQTYQNLDDQTQRNQSFGEMGMGCAGPQAINEGVEKYRLSVDEKLANNNARASQELPKVHRGQHRPELASMWDKSTTCLANIGSTTLRNIHAMELSTDESGKGKVSIICPEGPQRAGQDPFLVQTRWLHVQVSALSLDVLENVVLECPFIDANLMRVTLRLLQTVNERFMNKSETGNHMNLEAVLRCVGEYAEPLDNQESRETSALFLNSPYITHKPTSGRDVDGVACESNACHQTLLQSFYRFDVGEEREGGQVVRHMSKNKSQKSTLQVGQLWCLLIGSNVLVTCSDQSADEVLGNSITTSSRMSGNREPITITLIDDSQCHHTIVIEPNYNYVDFLRHAVAVVIGSARDATEYQLVGINNETLTPVRWLDILSLRRQEVYWFKLQRRPQLLLLEYWPMSRSRSASSIRRPSMQSLRRNRYLDAPRPDSRRGAAGEAEQNSSSASIRGRMADGVSLRSMRRRRLNGASASTETLSNVREIRNFSPSSISSSSDLEANENNQLVLYTGPRDVHRSDTNQVGSRLLGDRKKGYQNMRSNEYFRQNAGIVAGDAAFRQQHPDIYGLNDMPELRGNLFDSDSDLDNTISTVRELAEPIRQPSRDQTSPTPITRRTTVQFEMPANEQERGTGTREKANSDESDGANILEEPLRRPPTTTPFFAWRVTETMDIATAGAEELDKTVVKTLIRLDIELSKGDIGKLYLRMPKYSVDDVIRRHRLKRVSSEKVRYCTDGLSTEPTPDSHITAGNENTPAAEGVGQASTNTEKSNGSHLQREATHQQAEGGAPKRTNTSLSNDQDSTFSGDTHKTEFLGKERALMMQLLEISQDILWAFTPTVTGPTIPYLCRRYWGSLDVIFRQMIWDEVEDEGNDESKKKRKYNIRDFDEEVMESSQLDATPPMHKEKWSKCADCISGKDYETASEALEHLHERHFNCSGKTHRPYEDPCLVWLDRMWETRPKTSGAAITQAVEEFITTLEPFRSMINELHILVARAWDTQLDETTSTPLPRLPPSLVNAFRKIVICFILQSQSLLIRNRLGSMNVRANSLRSQRIQIRRKIESFSDLERSIGEEVIGFLEAAKKDIILHGNHSRSIDHLDIQAVGPEFLVLALVSASQNKPLIVETSISPTQPIPAIKLYQDYLSRLHFQANRRPKKRVFLDIHDFEEELGAFEKVVWAQTSLLGKYHLVTCPNSFRVRSTTRMGQHPVETSFATYQQNRVDDLLDAIGILRTKSKALKEQVKQMLEIVEEDHGKAIRVFTIVTLFFLPLSFVSSFMGMNTTDIRDTNYSQKVFWATAIPVTVAVLGLAFAYGYKGDEMGDWIVQKMGDWRENQSSRIKAAHGRNRGNITAEKNGLLRAQTFTTIKSTISDVTERRGYKHGLAWQHNEAVSRLGIFHRKRSDTAGEMAA